MKLKFILTIGLGLLRHLQGATLALPTGTENVDGNVGPSLGSVGVPTRTQQVYEASLFSGIAQGARISEIRFRVDTPSGNAFSSVSDLEVRLSTTTRSESTLSQFQNSNVGQNESVVFARQQITLSSGYISSGPNSFSVVIPFPNTFDYYPNQGNLLLDIFAYEPGFNKSLLDGQFIDGDGIAFVQGGIGSSSGATVVSAGFVTQFVYTPIPEPDPLWLFAVGIGLALQKGIRKHASS